MKKNIAKALSKSKIVVASHIFASGPTQALVKYLNHHNPARKLLFIGHPLLPRPGRKNISFCFTYKNGRKVKEIFFKNLGPAFSLHYIENFFLSIFWVLKTRQKWELFIGMNNFNALSGLVLKWLGRVKKVIFYGVDYAPKRFAHPIVNCFYHWVDKVAVFYADEIWSLSPRMVEARLKYRNLKIKRAKSKIVPMGVWFDEIKRTPFAEVKKHTLVFMGHLLKKQGVQMVIKAMPKIIKKIPDFQFLIIGKGEYGSELKRLVKAKGLEKQVFFTGYIKNHAKMEKLMSKSACAIAIYEKGDLERNFTYYADPGKIKDYLGAGLPVILTDVPHNAFEIEKAGCGRVIDNQEDKIAEAVIEMMSHEERLKKYRNKALDFAKEFDWNKIFEKAFFDIKR